MKSSVGTGLVDDEADNATEDDTDNDGDGNRDGRFTERDLGD